ncbi:MAG: TIGR03960 family B12-binding radical SAM protein [Candidatus Omnitrophota bacterium]|nr:TIGR03960 family B12-binding radical SAM protein [Candidatus Omnitrophota bacterium]
MLDDFLLQVQKPGRYIGNEWNVSRKDFHRAGIKFALCFPDLYEVGMSNLGIRILYGLLNNIPDVACERVFACAQDLEKILRESRREIFSLESQIPLSAFDIVGFSLGSELDYTNVLNILELGNIPLEASLRDHRHPLVIGGGPCALNPEPMHEFFDLFAIGEAEDLIIELIGAFRENKEEYKNSRISKEELLRRLASVAGVYVPALYAVRQDDASGAIKEFRPKAGGIPSKIKKRFVPDLNASFFPTEWLVPYIQIIHDRVSLEIMRGCPNRCRFCQARSQYFPYRQRDKDNVLKIAAEVYQNSGYEEISLAGLSVSDYPGIEQLLSGLFGLFKNKSVAVSLPSIKSTCLVGSLSRLIAQEKKTGLTFAPEAGTAKLRDILAKDFNEEEFFQNLAQAYLSGYQHVKLYFMLGLPFETEEDLGGIIDFSLKASRLRKEAAGRGPAQVNISVNSLIPKPHTPFQWLKAEGPDLIRKKQDYLKSKLKNKRIKAAFHDPQMSFLEGVLSRGDRCLSRVILAAFKKGARFDSWRDHFVFQRWLDAFSEAGIEPAGYLRQRHPDEFLPWDFIDCGIDKQLLVAEFKKLVADK